MWQLDSLDNTDYHTILRKHRQFLPVPTFFYSHFYHPLLSIISWEKATLIMKEFLIVLYIYQITIMNLSYFHPPTVPPKSRKREWMFFFIIVIFGVFGLVILLVRRKRMSGGGMSTSSSDACKQAQSRKRKCCYFDEIFTIGWTRSCHFENRNAVTFTSWTRSCHFDNRNAVTFTKFSLLAALEVVNLTACNVASDKNFIKMTFLFHWCRFYHIDGLVQNGHDDECHLGPLLKHG